MKIERNIVDQKCLNFNSDNLNLILISTNSNSEITYISPYTSTVFGYEITSDLKRQWWDTVCFYKEEVQINIQRANDIFSGKSEDFSKPYINKVICSDGSFKWIEWRDSLSNENELITIGVDITDRKSNEIVKLDAEAIINRINSMIFVGDFKGDIVFASPSVERVLGYLPEEVLGDKWWELTYESEFEANYVKNAIHDMVYNNVKNKHDVNKRRIPTKSGDYKWIEWQISRGINDTYISVGTDITNRVATEEELQLAKETAEKSVKVKDEFLANMSHEIRTPLNALIGFTDLLLETELTQEQKEHLETMRNSGDILLTLVNNVLDLAKLDSNKVEIEKISFDLHKNLHEIVKLMKIKAIEKNISLELDIQPNTPKYVIGDPTRLGQIMLNLVTNAIKFTNDGSVIISVKNLEDVKGKSQIYFEIKDTGIGIVSNKISTVFGVFTQAKSDTSRIYGGSGLGLAIVKKLVILLEGDIKVQSKFGIGSVFKMILPYEIDQKRTKEVLNQPDIAEDELLNLNILLVEDNKINQLLAITRLERWNCTVDIANNGIEGVKKVQNSMYDIILMDIQMPVMDGYEAAKIIKNDLTPKIAKIPIIAMTAYTSKNDIDRAYEVGMDAYVFKPFKTDELFAILKKFSNSTTELITDDVAIANETIDENFTNLTFLKDESLNETEILVLLIELFLKDLEEFNEEITLVLKSEDWEKLYKAALKIKPNVSLFGISKMEPLVHAFMEKNKHQDLEIDAEIKSCKKIISGVILELNEELKILKK